MEKEYYSKIALAFLLFLTIISPFGIFLYAFVKVTGESIMNASFASLGYLSSIDLLFSISVGLFSTLVSVLIGALICFYLIISGKTKLKYGILNIVLVLPHIGFAYIIYLFFSQTGFLFRFLDLFGIAADINLVNDGWGVGIFLNYVLKEIPFVILYLLATHKPQNKDHIFAATDLGAGYFETFRKIYLPLNSVQVVSISIVIFAFIIGNYEVPNLLGANTPQFFSVSALNNFQSIDPDQNIAAYLKVTIIFFTAFLMSIFLRLLVRRMR